MFKPVPAAVKSATFEQYPFDKYKQKIALIKELKKSYSAHEKQAQQAAQKETSTKFLGMAPDTGVLRSEMLAGYIFNLKVFLLANFDKLTDKEFLQMQLCIVELELVLQAAKKAREALISGKTDEFVNEKVMEVQQGFCLLATGYSTHANISRITKEQDKYYLTVYDAGAESIRISTNQVYSVVKRPIKITSSNSLFLFLKSIIIKDITDPADKKQSYQEVSRITERYLGEVLPEHSLIADAQHRRNCTTRGIREFLRSSLNSELFNNAYQFCSQDGANINTHSKKILQAILAEDKKMQDFQQKLYKEIAELNDKITAEIHSQSSIFISMPGKITPEQVAELEQVNKRFQQYYSVLLMKASYLTKELCDSSEIIDFVKATVQRAADCQILITELLALIANDGRMPLPDAYIPHQYSK